MLTDMDECSTGACDNITSTCVNTVGSYQCHCNTGYEPDQQRCKGHLSIIQAFSRFAFGHYLLFAVIGFSI